MECKEDTKPEEGDNGKPEDKKGKEGDGKQDMK